MTTIAEYSKRVHKSVPWSFEDPGIYLFTFGSSPTITPTAGATYTNNGETFTVISCSIENKTLTTSGTGAPSAAPSALIKASGTGDATIAYIVMDPASSVTVYFPPGCVGFVVQHTNLVCTMAIDGSTVTHEVPRFWPRPVPTTPDAPFYGFEPDAVTSHFVEFAFSGGSGNIYVVAYIDSMINASTTIETYYE